GRRARRPGARGLLDRQRRAAVRFRSHADRAPSDAGAGCGPGGRCDEMSASQAESGVRAVVEVLARALADRPDDAHVLESQIRHMTLFELYVSPQDIAKVIGRQGRRAAALRTLASTAGEKEGKQVTVEIREAR